MIVFDWINWSFSYWFPLIESTTSNNTYRIFHVRCHMLWLCLQFNFWAVLNNPLYRHLNEFIKGIQLLSNKTFLFKIRADDNPTRFLPQIWCDFFPFVLTITTISMNNKKIIYMNFLEKFTWSTIGFLNFLNHILPSSGSYIVNGCFPSIRGTVFGCYFDQQTVKKTQNDEKISINPRVASAPIELNGARERKLAFIYIAISRSQSFTSFVKKFSYWIFPHFREKM